ncbi:MAG TPA: hypothetical protein DCE01_00135 [Thermodesulfobacterium commune]|uniref:Glycosyltransferase family 9 protein n=1 Tax=Thermodesulfobacterium commune TaxID=1741 RepID=A0A3B8N226_9BACT|nr:hypothetical protein [Thermodesulfobacterium commune]
MLYLLLSYLFYPLIQLVISLKNRNKEFRKILVIQAAKIGDFICTTHVFREIKKAYPESRLTVMVNPMVKELAENNPYIDEVVFFSPKDYKGFLGKIKLANYIKKGGYDLGIALNPNLPFTIGLLWGLVPTRISILPNFCGLTFRLASKFYTYLEPHVSGQLVVETYLKLLGKIGIQSNNLSKEVYKTSDADKKVTEVLQGITKPLVGISVSSGNKLKELENEKIAEVINKILQEKDCYIVLIGSSQDKLKAQEVLKLVKNKEKVLDLTGRFSLGELPALLERLSVFIGVDTGITYMADALKIPIVYIPGPIDISEQHPTESRIFWVRENLSCAPCSFVFKTVSFCKNNIRTCVKLIDPEKIVAGVKKFLETSKEN